MPAEQNMSDAREPENVGGAHIPAARQGFGDPVHPDGREAPGRNPDPSPAPHHPGPTGVGLRGVAPGRPVPSVDGGSGLVESLMSGIPDSDRVRLLRMIAESVEAERTAAMEGTVRRQVDVGTRHRSSRLEIVAAAAGDAGDAGAAGDGGDGGDLLADDDGGDL